MRISLGGLIYLIIGMFVAYHAGYRVDTISHVLSYAIATVVWPAIFIFPHWRPSISV